MSVILSQHRWASLAQDLAVMTVPGTPLTELSTVREAYGISDEELKEILTIPAFIEMFKRSLSDMKALGSKAGVVYRSATLAQALSEKLFRDATASTGAMEAKDALKLLELLLKAGGLLDKPENTVNVQTNVGINLPLPQGLANPKLNHTIPITQGGGNGI